MSFVHNLWFRLIGPVDVVCDRILEWAPDDATNEARIEESLHAHLVRRLKWLDVRRQFPHDRVRADILVNEEVAIEIKRNLVTTAELHRLIGQLDTYARWGVRMVVVLVGEVDPDLKARVEARLLRDWDDEDEARVIHVPVSPK